MPIFLFFIMLKVAITALVLIVGAMFAAELLPQMAHWAVAASEGTMFASFADLFAQGLMFFARLAGQFLNFMYNILGAIGIDASSLKNTANGVNAAGPGPAPAVNAPPP